MWSGRASATVTSPPARPDRGQEGARPRRGRARRRGSAGLQLVDPSTSIREVPAPRTLGAHRAQEVGEVAHLGLARRVLDDGRALGQRRRHQQVVGRGVARVLEHDAGPDQAGRPARVPRRSRGEDSKRAPMAVEPVHVEVDRAVAEVVAAGHRAPRT